MQVITEQVCFEDFACLIRKESMTKCHRYDGRTMDTALHTLTEWAEQSCDLVVAIKAGILSLGNMIAAMVQCGSVGNYQGYEGAVLEKV